MLVLSAYGCDFVIVTVNGVCTVGCKRDNLIAVVYGKSHACHIKLEVYVVPEVFVVLRIGSRSCNGVHPDTVVGDYAAHGHASVTAYACKEFFAVAFFQYAVGLDCAFGLVAVNHTEVGGNGDVAVYNYFVNAVCCFDLFAANVQIDDVPGCNGSKRYGVTFDFCLGSVG